MDKIYGVCKRCGDRYCCRGLCKEMNDFLTKKLKKDRRSPINWTNKVVL